MTVYLVGAGPGDPGLLTQRGAELLGRADVVVYDRLSEDSLLELCRPGAELVYMGKDPGGPLQQEQINALLAERGRAGLEVVRLKGGDPFVFGRGGEEAEALIAAGVPFEVVPGVTSAIAVPAYAGIPVTQRGVSSSFTVVTGHSRQAIEREVDWEAIARTADTLVVLMGVAHRAEIAKRLMDGGLPASTPVACVSTGTRPDQVTLRTTLDRLGDAEMHPPTVIVVGQVAGLDFGWFERRPLFGLTIVVTRAREQASSLATRLEALGAQVVQLPTIEIADPSDGGAALARAAAEVRTYDWVVFTSANAVERFVGRLRDGRAFGQAQLAAIGPGTADALRRRNLEPDLVPARAVGEALVAAFPAPPAGGGRVLLPRAAAARDVVPDGLTAAGWTVDVVEAYRTVPAVPSAQAIARATVADAITFTSASTVARFLEAAGREALPRLVVCIGPITAQAARDAGVDVDVVAEEHSIDGLVAALLEVRQSTRAL
jgi:uroporphyrinogen III methyltransferase/synthase